VLSLNILVTQEHFHTLPFHHSRWPISRRVLSPFRYLTQADPMLYNRPFNDNGEFGHRTGPRDDWIVPESGDREGHGFVEGFGLYVNAVRDTGAISERDTATGDAHEDDYNACFAFCSPLLPTASPISLGQTRRQ
jgi:hypothetical protein